MAAGPGKYDDNGKLIPMPVKEGDLVVFAKYSGTEVKLDGEEYLVLAGLGHHRSSAGRASLARELRMLILCSNEGDKVHGKTAFVW